MCYHRRAVDNDIPRMDPSFTVNCQSNLPRKKNKSRINEKNVGKILGLSILLRRANWGQGPSIRFDSYHRKSDLLGVLRDSKGGSATGGEVRTRCKKLEKQQKRSNHLSQRND